MSNKDYEIFQACWTKFADQLKGRMILQAKKETFNYTMLNLILADCTEFWDSHSSEGGRWLEHYEKRNPQKCSIIRDILVRDMKFRDTSENVSNNEIVKYALPVGSAIAGFVLSRNAYAGKKVLQALCTAAPAAITYPISNEIVDTAREKKKKRIIQRYLEQLDRYKISVENILLDDE